jgi:AcrR family transcriptional regulator
VRQQDTKTSIEQSFLKLLREKYFDKITVKDIVDDCGVTRNTFYYHFQDVYDIIDATLKRELKKAVRDSLNSELSWEILISAVVRFFVSDKKIAVHIFKSSKKDEICTYIDRVFKLAMDYYIGIADKEQKLKSADRELIADFYRFAMIGLLKQWVSTGMRSDIEQDIMRSGILFKDNIKKAARINCI